MQLIVFSLLFTLLKINCYWLKGNNTNIVNILTSFVYRLLIFTPTPVWECKGLGLHVTDRCQVSELNKGSYNPSQRLTRGWVN